MFGLDFPKYYLANFSVKQGKPGMAFYQSKYDRSKK